MSLKKYIAILLSVVMTLSTISPTFAADTVVPVFSSALVNGSTLTMTYNEILDSNSVPATTAFKVMVAGVVRSVSAVSIVDKTVKLTLTTPVINGNVVTVTYTKGVPPIQDLAGNDAITLAAKTATNSTLETIPPVLSTVVVNGSTLTLTYNEALDTASVPAATDFSVNVDGINRSVSGVSVSGKTVVVTLTSAVLGGQTVTISYAANLKPIQDLAGNDALSLTAKAVTNSTPLDKTAPVFASSSVNGSTVTIVYNESLDAAAIPPPGAFKVLVNNVVRPVSNVTISGTQVALTLSTPVINGNTVTVAYTKGTPALQDISKNAAITYTAKAVTNTTPETTPPLLSTATINADSILLTYNEALDTASVPSSGDFTVTVNGSPRNVTAVTVSGTAVRLTIDTPVLSIHVVSVSYTPGAKPIQDALGNDAVSLTSKSVTNSTPKDTIVPVFSSANVDIATLTLVYNEKLDPASIPLPGAFKVMVNNVVRPVSNVNISGQNVVLTLSTAVSKGNTVTVAYTKGTTPTQDLTGNDAITFTSKTVTNITPADTIPPILSTAVINGSTVTLTYSENIDTTSVPANNAFSFQIDNAVVTPASVSVSTNKIMLTINPGVGHGVKVKFGYTKGAQPIRDLYNNQAISLSAVEVTNLTPDTVPPVLQSATVDTGLLMLTYDEPVDIASTPAAYNYTVTVNDIPRTPISVSVSGNAVTMMLSPVVASGETVQVAYSGNTVQDSAGNDAPVFTTLTVTNNTPDTTPPILQSATVVDGILTLTYHEALDTLSLPTASDFTVTGGHMVTLVTVSASSVVLQISPAVQPGEVVALSYVSNANLGPIQDVFGNDAAGLINTAVTNATVDTTAPTLISSVIEKSILTLTMSEPLDENSLPVVGQFTITAQGVVSPVSGVQISGNLVKLTLAKPVLANENVTFDYVLSVVPKEGNALNVGNPLQDITGNDLLPITGLIVTNTTPALPRITKWSRYIYLGGEKVATVEDSQDPYTGEVTKKTIVHLSDHLGGSNIDTDTNGEVLQITDYLPFGSERIVLEKTTTYKNKYRFIGKERDKESDLLYVEARYYESDLGRFISQDPVFWAIGNSTVGQVFMLDPQQMNSYSYSRNNPITYSDPTGESGMSEYFSYFGGQQTMQEMAEWSMVFAEEAPKALDKMNELIIDNLTPINDVKGCADGSVLSCGAAAVSLIPGGKLAKEGATIAVEQVAKHSDEIIGLAKNYGWGLYETLQKHYDDHATRLGITKIEDYVKNAKTFFDEKLNYSHFVDEKGVTRVYDNANNIFGSYNADGTTKTFFSPTSENYWATQIEKYAPKKPTE